MALSFRPPDPVDNLEQQPSTLADPPTILVCDDDPSLRELVRAVLGPRYRFIEAADGKEASRPCASSRPI